MKSIVFDNFDYTNLVKFSSSNDQFIKKEKLAAKTAELSIYELEKSSPLASIGPLLSIYIDNFVQTTDFSVDSYSLFSPEYKYKSYHDLIINLSVEDTRIEVMTSELCQLLPKQKFTTSELDIISIDPAFFPTSQERKIITLKYRQALMCQLSRYPYRILDGGKVLRLKGYFCLKSDLI